MLDELSNAQKVRIGGIVQLTVRVKPAQKKRQGRNPATGEQITIAAKPASVDVRARALARAKRRGVGAEGTPSTRRLINREKSRCRQSAEGAVAATGVLTRYAANR